MPHTRAIARSRSLVRTGRDFVIGLGFFALVALALGNLQPASTTSPQPLFSTSAFAAAPHATWAVSHPIQSDTAVYGTTGRREATIILAVAFAALVAFNLAVFRHLRRVYASPR